MLTNLRQEIYGWYLNSHNPGFRTDRVSYEHTADLECWDLSRGSLVSLDWKYEPVPNPDSLVPP